MDRVGVEWGRADWLDENIIAHLHSSGKTFHTLDSDFNHREYCHTSYCLVFYDYSVRTDEDARSVADVIARFLRHPLFNTHAKRLGKVIRVTDSKIEFFDVGRHVQEQVEW